MQSAAEAWTNLVSARVGYDTALADIEADDPSQHMDERRWQAVADEDLPDNAAGGIGWTLDARRSDDELAQAILTDLRRRWPDGSGHLAPLIQ
jgi:hypothetical protein